jgi:cytochrome c biogenesis protein CcdA/thiol-disulfide isomerase/thioredoxin
MFLLILFSFIAGVATILSPCILPVLPIVLSGTVGNGKKKPLGIILGFILSFTVFTLITSEVVKATGVSADLLRDLSIVIIFIFGASLLIPNLQVKLETFFSGITSKLKINNQRDTGFVGGVIIGLSLGLLWTPCVGPIIASVIVLAATSKISAEVFLITLSYSLGTGLAMFVIMQFGRKLFQKIPWLLRSTEKIQKVFGFLMILTAIALFLNFDRKFQIVLQKVLPDASFNQIENNSIVKKELSKLSSPSNNVSQAPEIVAGGEWFNSKPLTLKNLRGKVVIIDFWTYTCINCIRTLPYIEAWYKKYKDQGLIVIGVHTPEFEFEKNPDNVAKSLKDFGITYPVVQDNNYDTWNAFSNQYWPAKYFIDKNGNIRDSHFGEGNYDESEKLIQDLLKETGAKIDARINNPASNIMANSPETYLNSSRMQYYYPDTNLSTGDYSLKLASGIPLNTFSLGGKWEIGNENATVSENSTLLYHFSADKVFLVMKPGSEGQKYQLKVFLDDKVVNLNNSGADVKNGTISVDTDRLYNLIDLKNHPGEHVLKLEFQTAGLQLFAFTFG